MPDDILPVITESDYAAFQKLIVEMPITWEEWLAVSKQKERWRRLEGLSMREMSISPAEFEGWFGSTSKRKPKLHDLLRCAIAFACQSRHRSGDHDLLDDNPSNDGRSKPH
jgi:hypothetical protein